MSPTRQRIARLSIASLLAAACAPAAPPPRVPIETAPIPAAPASPRPECHDQTALLTYLAGIKDEVAEHWEDPPLSAPGASAVVAFTVTADGQLAASSVVEASSDVAGREALRALDDAAPFGPIPGDQGCYTFHRVRATFERPHEVDASPYEGAANGDRGDRP